MLTTWRAVCGGPSVQNALPHLAPPAPAAPAAPHATVHGSLLQHSGVGEWGTAPSLDSGSEDEQPTPTPSAAAPAPARSGSDDSDSDSDSELDSDSDSDSDSDPHSFGLSRADLMKRNPRRRVGPATYFSPRHPKHYTSSLHEVNDIL